MSTNMSDLRKICSEMRLLQANKDEIEENLKVLNQNLDELRLRKIPEMMAALEVKTATFEGIGRVQLAADLYCSTVTGQKEAAMAWLRDCGQDGMISESYNASSMKAYIRRLIEDGATIPEFMNVTPFMRASIVKA